jgi:hypothetical protein
MMSVRSTVSALQLIFLSLKAYNSRIAKKISIYSRATNLCTNALCEEERTVLTKNKAIIFQVILYVGKLSLFSKN